MLHLVDLALNEEPVFQTPVRIPLAQRPCPPGKTSNLYLSADLPLQELGEILKGRFEIVSIVFDQNGITVDLKREEASSAESLKNRVPYKTDFKLAPGTYACRVIIRNLETGRGAVGGISVTVEDGQKSH
jgi:hypothetical protein